MKGILIDISGTLVTSNGVARSTINAINKLKLKGIPFRICSNASKESHNKVISDLSTKLDGIDLNPNHVITAISSSKSYVTHSNLNPLLLLSNSAKDDFKDYSSDKTDYDSVLIGLSAESLNYPNLNNAFRILNQPGSQLIATHASKYFADKDNQLSLGPGGFVKALEYVTDKKAIICGKPSDEFFISCLKSLNLRESDWKDVAIIGDDALSDLGTSLPLRKVLVRTGKYRRGDEDKVKDLYGIYDTFADFVDSID
ncbi:HAD-like protein [Wallemia mellicola]|uniref:HAD-like protein n=2 Tax=Wallemia mellicola TaxID=1708541 RepID=A0A4T0LX89_9BASI|nr:HAD-like protein [Wallemia mellicola CBS 633.66]TIB74689.1 hypothetical protein E3Q24_00432 [Wallemia mellicola]EIM24153.1 HAD-like protein [Wallemia mellicola CBS 633.66]TIB79502.1 hypothetical protein E3Q23_00136 [Wallemia mellicola]TIB82653.1 HAD-like protein [Wallemia mellicola]TIB89459.1 HAD-like protein [Wallemia mellicola]|eukprot:XP_006955977.1 HAD-like protein [Wallemia mellicola CBS 633.66]